MLPPVLEIYVVWHPRDVRGRDVALGFFDHFHGTPFTGLIGGAIEVCMRYEGWRSPADAPRPIPFPGLMPSPEVPAAQLVAVVPVLGTEFASEVEVGTGAWRYYSEAIVTAQRTAPGRVGVFPFLLDRGADQGTVIGQIFQPYLRIGTTPGEGDPASEQRCRDLAQGIAQLVNGPDARVQVFISHTKRPGTPAEEENVTALIATVRGVIAETRLRQFFDANDLQPGRDWDHELRTQAAASALLALRTDLYASREWCQREMLIAKCHGMPIVIVDSLGAGEERGSFLMDHVPRIPARRDGTDWRTRDILRGLNLLVDECLKRALWQLQRQLSAARPELGVDWWAPHAPEPVTLAAWLVQAHRAGTFTAGSAPLRILHPDPPLGPDERAALQQIAALSGQTGPLEVLTPRLLAARGA